MTAQVSPLGFKLPSQPWTQPGLPLLPPRANQLVQRANDAATLFQSLALLGLDHLRRIAESHGTQARAAAERMNEIWSVPRQPGQLALDWAEYAQDATQRGVLFLDIMRQVGNQVVDQQTQGNKPVLVYDYDLIVDGQTLPRPVNYSLVQILPPAGTIDPTLRPYIIIDPRAGHGPGIGGFKSDSQVGVALSHGHPVYFVIFLPEPVPGQTLADVTAAEARFVREVARRHPNALRPVIVGNCQGGWAAMLLCATNPDITGPVVANGAPLSYWAGVRGKNPLRYLGGLGGGALPPLMLADLGDGVFDGAWLVQNFETMNPGNTWWRKYYDVFAKTDAEAERFIGFERWWSGFYLMNEAEIRWIVENLFIGNKLQRGTATLGGRGSVDLRKIKAPIIVFASHGDDITPPQQALNWIPALYASEQEIRARGQRIIYMIHKDIGHLGIFVSAKVARTEHTRIVTTLEAIEALAPGLYEMIVEQKIGEGIDAQFVVSFAERSFADLKHLDDGHQDETPFAAVSRVSEFLVDMYEMGARPFVRASATPATAAALRAMHPMRARRTMLSDQNPAMQPVAALAAAVREGRKPAMPDNPFLQAEQLWARGVEQMFDYWKDTRDAMQELMFFALWGSPFMTSLGGSREKDVPAEEIGESLRELPEVQAALMNIDRGGYAEAVIRMLIMMAKSRGAVRQSRLERSNAILTSREPFMSMGDAKRSQVITEQTLIVDYDEPAAFAALPGLLPTPAERERAIALVEEIAGDKSEMTDATLRMLARLRDTLSLPPLQLGAAPAPAAPAPTPASAVAEPEPLVAE